MVTIDNIESFFGINWSQSAEFLFPDFSFNRYNNVICVTVKVALEHEEYKVSVSHPTEDIIAHIVCDWISYEKMQVDIIPEVPKSFLMLI